MRPLTDMNETWSESSGGTRTSTRQTSAYPSKAVVTETRYGTSYVKKFEAEKQQAHGRGRRAGEQHRGARQLEADAGPGARARRGRGDKNSSPETTRSRQQRRVRRGRVGDTSATSRRARSGGEGRQGRSNRPRQAARPRPRSSRRSEEAQTQRDDDANRVTVETNGGEARAGPCAGRERRRSRDGRWAAPVTKMRETE